VGVYKRMLIEEEELEEPLPDEMEALEMPIQLQKTIARNSGLMSKLFPDPVIAHWDDDNEEYFYEGIPNT